MTEPTAKSEIASAYDDWAETYDAVPNRTRDLAGHVLHQASLNLGGRAVVEVGCGTGRNTEWLARSEAGSADSTGAGPVSVTALDFSVEMLAHARARVSDPRVRFIQHDVQNRWPVDDASVDVVIAMLILEHVEHLEPFFAEAARALSANGDLFICELHSVRQYLGGQAQFVNTRTGEYTRVAAFLHDVSDYLNPGLAAGFDLLHLGEWRDEEEPNDPPRLLSVHFRRTQKETGAD